MTAEQEFVIDPTDGLRCSMVGEWAREKHERLTKYIDISRFVRRKWLDGNSGEATFIDLFSGPGRCQIRGQSDFIDGGCVAGWKKSEDCGAPFTRVLVSDADDCHANTSANRLRALRAPVTHFVGQAEHVVEDVVKQLSPHGLHFAYLDPFDLDSLPFSIIRQLASLKRMDMLIHISLMDLQRNAVEYSNEDNRQLDRFAPDWRKHVSPSPHQATFRANFLGYWKSLIKDLGMQIAEGIELVRGTQGQRLYWLAFVARNSTAIQFWNEIRNVDGQRNLL
ncbi:three-Cys-motif partner protein TcmP [Dongia sp.]|uniref:three-Cys-motif partner protein TcmP n=1 Tax=Dongia sp. TaxID=1977262 RepID=UPI0035ADB842